MEGLAIRRATAADANRVAELIGGDPGAEAIGIVGDRERARRFGVAFALLPGGPQGWEHSVVAELEGKVVGVLQSGARAEDVRVTPGLVLLAARALGLRLFGVLPRWKARGRVQVLPPEGTYHIGELDVDPELRNRGIGGALLDWAETDARERGFAQMSLSTTTSNPAQRLYKRHGFRLEETRIDPDYQRYTGIEGRMLMLKELG